MTKNHTEGQTNRKMNVIDIEDLLHLLLPLSYDTLAGKIAFQMSLCPDTVKYSYLSMFMAEKIIWMDKHGIVYLTEKTPIQDIDDNVKKISELREEKQKFSLDLNDFIHSNNYEKLSDSELIEKINMQKNEKLKNNWINQIKNRKE